MPDLAFNPDLASHEFDQLFADRQAKSRAAMRASCRAVSLSKALEDQRTLRFIDPDAGVGHLEAHKFRRTVV